jgi:cellulose synthase/poly-beta-1,6-N-acetylglucosamine synthase-like glycosyltransferase
MLIFILLIFLLLLLNYTFFLSKIIIGLNKLKKIPFGSVRDEFISIIIPFRNEAANIRRSLKSIEHLDYPEDKFEIIYVDDNSSDNSFNLLKSGTKKSNIRILKLPGEIHSSGNKKQAVEYGIKNSSGDIVVTTDADCIHQKNWLRALMNEFDPETSFVSGPVELIEDKSLFSKIQKLEFEGLILAGAGLIGSGTTVICNGANIAYRKSVFNEVNGFADNATVASGDDVMLMQKISSMKIGKIKFCRDIEALVWTNASKNLKEFMNQRKRWASKSIYYKDKFLLLNLILIFLFYAGLLVQPILILSVNKIFWFTLALSVLVKLILEYIIIKKGKNIFPGRKNISLFLLTEFLQVPYILISAIIGLSGKFEWKDRIIKH